MSDNGGQIVVAGDATIDWFFYPVPASDDGENWRRRPAAHAAALPGGVLLLAEFVRHATCGQGFKVLSPELPDDVRIVAPEQVVHSNAMLATYQLRQGDQQETLRVQQSLGFIGPADGRPVPCPPDSNPDEALLIVLDDAGNGFREDAEAWPRALSGSSRSLVVHKMCRPIGCGPLWERIRSQHAERHVLVLNAADLRGIPGVDISCALSWERTARDFVHHMQRSEQMQDLRWCPYLIVLFGTDGAIVHYGKESAHAVLIFDPGSLEGDFAARIPGHMNGLTSVFTATLVAELASGGAPSLESGVRRGLARMRRLLACGFVHDGHSIGYPLEQIFSEPAPSAFQSCPIPRVFRLNEQEYWRILDQKTRNTRPLVAEEIVLFGESEGLQGVPIGTFGALRTIDRAEIESYSAIRGLIAEFLANPKADRPLCFAVFGPPGAGKSFGVTQVVESLRPADIDTIGFNISQFRGYGDLVAAFHQVRNISLRGRIPFVFFDEFDAAADEGPLGWLKYFLAPMQDAEFKEGGAVHPIGKAIFVFAGGTRSSYQEFASNMPAEVLEERGQAAFKAAKGPDFISRLRGHINVMVANRQHADDNAFVIRRAMVLRSMLHRNPKARRHSYASRRSRRQRRRPRRV